MAITHKSSVWNDGHSITGPLGKLDLLPDSVGALQNDGLGNLTWAIVAGGSSPLFTSSTPGIVPASGGGTVNYLRADGTWAASSASVAWGGITGTLSSQTDLNSALNGKQATLGGTGFVKSTAGVISYDTSTYLTTLGVAADSSKLGGQLPAFYTYSLPTATNVVLGGVKPDGTTLTNTAGALSVTYGSAAATACVGNDTRLSDTRTPSAHVLNSASHTVSGLTTGNFLKATSATTFGFAAHGLTYTDVGAQVAGSYQPTATILTTLSALANASGYLFNNGSGTLSYATPGGAGTVTSVSTAAANNGVTATWSMASPTPALTIGLGAITPSSINTGTGTYSGVLKTTDATAATSKVAGSIVAGGGIAASGSVWCDGLISAGAGTPPAYTNIELFAYDTYTSYMQGILQNLSNNANASTDWVATADTGNDSTNYIDMGINSSAYSVGTWTINGALDGYLYTQSTNIAVGTATAGKNLVLFTGGTLAANARLTISDTAVTPNVTLAMAALGTCTTAAAGTNTTQVASTAFATAGNNTLLGIYRTVDSFSGSHIAAKVAGTYMLTRGDALAVSGTGTLYPVAIINIAASDFPTINSLAPKLRIRGYVAVNAVAPTGNFTIGLYPATSGAGAAGLKIWTVGTLVTGSAATTVTAPAASSNISVVGSDFALPADGAYVLAVVTTATIAVSSLVHVGATLQARNA